MKKEYSIIACGRVFNPPNWFYNPAYIVNRIYYITSGTAYYKKSIPLKPGFLYVFRADPEFRVSQSETNPVDHTYFDFLTYKKIIPTDYLEIDVSGNPPLYHFLKSLEADFHHPPQGKIAEACLDLLLYHLSDAIIPDTSYSETTSAALDLIHTLPVHELSVNTLADHAGKNVDHLIRCFTKELGMTPHKYISMLKTNLAISSLRRGLSCTEIAELLGFGSLSAFSSFFKSETGQTPSKLRMN